MGCISSKLKADDLVGRCKARKNFMKQAVVHRHAFAAAHTAYLLALRNTGAALRQFAEGEGGVPAGPFAVLPEPPPPPPVLPNAKSDSPSSATTKEIDVAEDSVPKEWDFFEPFLPTDPPLHLKERRKTVQQDCDLEASKIDEQQPHTVEDDKPHQSVDAGETHEDTAIENKDELIDGPKDEQFNKDELIDGPNDEHREEGDIEHELGMMLTVNAKKDLLKIVKELDEEFLKASAGGADVTRALETRKTHVHTDLPKSKFRSYNSARVFSALSWNWSRSSLSSKEELESNVDESGRNASHVLTLERLLAWEKKLFEEVKVVESLRVEREKKCSILRHQETRGEDAIEIDKTRAEIKRLHSLILVSYQGVDSTIEAIEDLRDDELHPQLVCLIEGLMNMWITMHQCHAKQTQIIIHIKNLDAMMTREPTSDSHHQATIQLERELAAWHESFCKLVGSQRGYMAALYGWLKLSLLLIRTGKEKNRAMEDDEEARAELEVYRLCEEWQRALGCLPDKVASEAIKSLGEVVKAMVSKQGEEMKQKRKVEKLEKQWEKKARALEPLEEQEESRARGVDDNEQGEGRASMMMMPIGLMERRAAVAAMKKRVEGETMKHWRAVQDSRVLTMNNLQTGLPGVLEAMAGFSAVCSQAFQHLFSLTRFPHTQ